MDLLGFPFMKLQLNAGEKAMSMSPSVTLDNGLVCTPQHFLNFTHTLESISSIVLDCKYHAHFPVFAYQEKNMLFIQVGIVGKDNYQLNSSSNKIVYGRKWFIDGFTTTSEIIQTIMLAIQKAKEHEIRELLQVTSGQHTTTPFNCHLDVPLISAVLSHQNTQLKQTSNEHCEQKVRDILSKVKFSRQSIHVTSITPVLEEVMVVTCQVEDSELNRMLFGDLNTLSFIINEISEEAVLTELIKTLINASNQEVNEYFLYKKQNVFSRKTSISLLSTLATSTRNRRFKQGNFGQIFDINNYQTDQKRLPQAATTELHLSLDKALSQFEIEKGILPDWLTSK